MKFQFFKLMINGGKVVNNTVQMCLEVKADVTIMSS